MDKHLDKVRQLNYEPKFKKDLTEIEIKGIEYIINSTHLFPHTTRTLEMAYTSSSDYAMHNACNGRIKFNGQVINHFAITENNMLIMVCKEEENYFYYEIESSMWD